MLNDQESGSCLEVSNRTNQFQIQFVREPRDPLPGMTRALCKMKEKRPVLRRSILILFTKNLFLQRTERPVIETSVIQARSSEDRKDPNVEKEHERTRRLVTVNTTPQMTSFRGAKTCAQNSYREK